MRGEAYVLPDDVLLVPVGDLDPALRARFDAADGDVAITRPGSRSTSRVVDDSAAQFLKRFRRPITIIAAVQEYARSVERDPRQVLEEALPLVRNLIDARWLVETGGSDVEAIRARFFPGDGVQGVDILACIQALEDVEVYKTRLPDGRLAALKVLRPSAMSEARVALEHERQILMHLGGRVGPALYNAGQGEIGSHLLLEWIDGRTASATAEECRRDPTPAARDRLQTLGVAILEAYSSLHARGVVHGDVHGRNIIIADSGSARLIDFGLSTLTGPDGTTGSSLRGGIGYFLDPTYAERRLADRRPGRPSVEDEQYALAALLYWLFIGDHYLEFSLDRDEQLRQIRDEVPLPFEKRGVPPWPGVEGPLMRALAKDPKDRFASVAAFAAAIDWQNRDRSNASAVPITCWPGPAGVPSYDPERLLLGVTGWDSARHLELSAPTASVTFGAAGVAYALYRMACLRDDAGLLSAADVWSCRARSDLPLREALENREVGVYPKTVGTTSPYHGASGVHLVQALVSNAMGDQVSKSEAVREFVMASRGTWDRPDLTTGRTGTLLGCALLLEVMPDDVELRSLAKSVLGELWDRLSVLDPIERQVEIRNLGIAHGWGGLLYATLCWCAVSGDPLPATCEERLRELAGCAWRDAGALVWPRLVPSAPRPGQSKDTTPSWCNGGAGLVHLWTLASRTLGDRLYSDLAAGAGRWVQNSGDPIANLCCGLVGRSYALLNLYRHTGDKDWLEAAQDLAQRIDIRSMPTGFDGLSLYKGELGLALLSNDLDRPDRSLTPFFEAEGRLAGRCT